MNSDYFEITGKSSGFSDGDCLLNVVLKIIDKSYFSGFTPRQKAEQLSILARKAALMSAELSGICVGISFHKNSEGMPLSQNGIWWGVSHKPEIVAGAVSHSPVGLDVEIIRPVSERLMERVSDKSERTLFKDDPVITFFKIWTSKEAVLKLLGKGLSGLSECKIHDVIANDHISVRYKERIFSVTCFVSGTYIISVVSLPDKVKLVYDC
ncbi:4'-phosphopantetheinyl transferase family protein [Desulforegula conservatrix]|uniref:4'-phosphopantetheinyl transferase family protein n=1 Tax=Desulforegula conservatrix TaxID=153026 RepID=UPI0018DB0A37|nr:4'-phosphopantetheinyl transferase superfamily protein [Desulforegula conservatrix]